MESLEKIFEQKIRRLKEARLRLLRLHKLLVDKERASFERENGQVSSGMFLNLLLNDKNFAWLKNFSTLIVEIDEMLDLDDGYSDNMIEKHFGGEVNYYKNRKGIFIPFLAEFLIFNCRFFSSRLKKNPNPYQSKDV